MRIKYTMQESEQNSLHPQTCAAILNSLHPQMPRCAATFSSLNKAFVELPQKPTLKVSVPNAI